MTKDLKEKAVKIQGKDYVLVADRIAFFNDNYPNGCIQTEELPTTEPKEVKIKAVVIPDIEKPQRFFTGHSQAVIGTGFINRTSALENAETSAVGRALGMMGIGVIESVSSADEVRKAQLTAKALDSRETSQNSFHDIEESDVDESLSTPANDTVDDATIIIPDQFASWSKAKAMVEVMALRTKGKIQAETAAINKMSREELIKLYIDTTSE